MKKQFIRRARDIMFPFFIMGLNLMCINWSFAGDITAKSNEDSGKQEEKSFRLEEVIVTAQKREESFQDVPISISNFTAIQLEDAGVGNILELSKQIPNVYLKYAEPENTIIIRGVTSFHSSLYAPAGFYVDDVNFPMQYMHNPDLFDVERIEVLKGPQGTLYGRNTESGVVNIITKQPSNEFKGKLLAEYGNYNSIKAGVDVSGPIIDNKLFLGASVQKKTSDGSYTNVYDGNDQLSDIDHLNSRATLRWVPSEALDISFIADFLKDEDGYGFYRFADGPYKTKRYEVKVDYPENRMDQDGNGQTLKVTYRGSFFDFLSVTSNRSYEKALKGDRDGTPYPIQYHNFSWEDEQQSQEFRFTSNNEGQLQWLFGLYGFLEDAFAVNNVVHIKQGDLWNNRTDINITGYAAFTQLTYTLWDKFHITGGLRADHHKLEGTLRGSRSYLTPSGQKLAKDLDYDELLPKLALSYDVNDDFMCYVSATKGYLIGGYNYVSAYSQSGFTYDREYTWNYEAGIKTEWLDNSVSLNASVFYIDIKDKQVFEIDQTFPVPGAQNITNAAEAHSVGGEIELHARPLDGLDIFAHYGVTEAKIDDWVATESLGVTYDYKDKYLTYFPKNHFNMGVQYRSASGWMGRIDFIHTGKIYGDNKNSLSQGAYQEVNVRVGYEGDRFDFVVWAKNIFDEEYYNYMTNYGTSTLVVDGAPRTFGATLTYRF